MWIITYKDKPVTKAKLDQVLYGRYNCRSKEEALCGICSKTKASTIAEFIYYYGYTFKEFKDDKIGILKI